MPKTGDAAPAMLGEVRQVDLVHGPGQAGAEAQGEGAGQDGPQRTIHPAKRSGSIGRLDPARIMPATFATQP